MTHLIAPLNAVRTLSRSPRVAPSKGSHSYDPFNVVSIKKRNYHNSPGFWFVSCRGWLWPPPPWFQWWSPLMSTSCCDGWFLVGNQVLVLGEIILFLFPEIMIILELWIILYFFFFLKALIFHQYQSTQFSIFRDISKHNMYVYVVIKSNHLIHNLHKNIFLFLSLKRIIIKNEKLPLIASRMNIPPGC